MDKLKDIELFLLDMDGTIYHEDTLINGTLNFINCLKGQKKQFVFLTNNSSNSGYNYVNKLKRLGIDCNIDNIFTSGMAMGIFLREYEREAKVYLVGTKAFENELLEYGVNVTTEYAEDIDCVVVGFDQELTYGKLVDACKLIASGAKFYGTNLDLLCPIKGDKYIPDCGCICNMIIEATKVQPYYIGKPKKDMVDILSKKFNLSLDKIAVVGDRLYTDIAIGKNAGIVSVCVLTGETKLTDIEKSDIVPDYVFESINELYKVIK